MIEATITIERQLLEKLARYAEAAGHCSGEEFAAAILQREIEKIEDASASEKIKDRLRGLGYIS